MPPLGDKGPRLLTLLQLTLFRYICIVDDKLHWFAAYVMSCQERQVAIRLARLQIESYLPIRREIRKWSDRKKVVEVLVLPRIIFVHATESQRRQTLKKDEGVPGLYRYLTTNGPYTAAIIPDAEMETFRAMVEMGREKVTLEPPTLAPGDRVRVVSGPLQGLECELVSVGARHCLAARLGMLGTATMELSTDTLQKIEETD